MDSAICWIPYIYPVDNAEIPYPLATIERACYSRWIALSMPAFEQLGHGAWIWAQYRLA